MMSTKTELDKLTEYLISRRIMFERFDEEEEIDENGRWVQLDRHQICVPEEGENCRWDAVCHRGSYGWECDLLEICGEIVTEEDGDTVVGYLTAEDVIRRLEGKNNGNVGCIQSGRQNGDEDINTV